MADRFRLGRIRAERKNTRCFIYTACWVFYRIHSFELPRRCTPCEGHDAQGIGHYYQWSTGHATVTPATLLHGARLGICTRLEKGVS